jgi:cytochrome P450
LANGWAILRDERVYREPDTFNPSRYLSVSEGGNNEPFPDSPQFGYGRRICPGQYFADNSLWIAIATILSLFEIQRVKDEFGNDIIPPVAFNTGVTSHPKPYECNIELRGQWARRLLDDVEIALDRK